MEQKDYVSFKIAKLIKEKTDFDIPFEYRPLLPWLFCMYDEYGQIHWGSYDKNWYFRVPYPVILRWLREREKLAYNILIIADGELGDLHYSYEIQEMDNEFLQINGSLDIKSPKFDTYEEAVEAALKYILENLI